MKPGDELYDAKVKVLQEQVLHHVEEEEGELFPQVEASEIDLDALGKKMAERKAALLSKSPVEANSDKFGSRVNNGAAGQCLAASTLLSSGQLSAGSGALSCSSTLCAIAAQYPTK